MFSVFLWFFSWHDGPVYIKYPPIENKQMHVKIQLLIGTMCSVYLYLARPVPECKMEL